MHHHYFTPCEYKPAVSACQNLVQCNQLAGKLHFAVEAGCVAALHCYELSAGLCQLWVMLWMMLRQDLFVVVRALTH
jgi:hypothetical protein